MYAPHIICKILKKQRGNKGEPKETDFENKIEKDKRAKERREN
jgi:hypothetical protein